jgi:hypothetical protein
MPSIAEQLAAIAKNKQASLEAAQPTAPAALMVPTEQRLAEAAQNAGQLQQPVMKPSNISDEVWANMPDDVKALVALGPEAQAVPVNPPEAEQGLVESATGKPLEKVDPTKADPVETPNKPRRTRIKKASPDAAIVEQLATLNAKVDALTAAVEEISQAIVGAVQILVSK